MLAFAEFLQNYFIIPVGMLIFVLWIGFKFYSKYIKPAKKLSGQLSVLINALKLSMTQHIKNHPSKYPCLRWVRQQLHHLLLMRCTTA